MLDNKNVSSMASWDAFASAAGTLHRTAHQTRHLDRTASYMCPLSYPLLKKSCSLARKSTGSDASSVNVDFILSPPSPGCITADLPSEASVRCSAVCQNFHFSTRAHNENACHRTHAGCRRRLSYVAVYALRTKRSGTGPSRTQSQCAGKRRHKTSPGYPYRSTGDWTSAPLGIVAPPEGPTSMIGGVGLLRADTTVASPPPTTAPTAKQAACMAAALGISE